MWFTVWDRGRGAVAFPALRRDPGDRGVAAAFTRSLALAGLTVVIVLVLMVPTVVLVELRLPRLRTTVELLTLTPLVLPPIALVVGVRSVLSWAPDYFLNTRWPRRSSRSRSRNCPGSSSWSTSCWRCRSSTARWTPGCAAPT